MAGDVIPENAEAVAVQLMVNARTDYALGQVTGGFSHISIYVAGVKTMADSLLTYDAATVREGVRIFEKRVEEILSEEPLKVDEAIARYEEVVDMSGLLSIGSLEAVENPSRREADPIDARIHVDDPSLI